MELHVSFLQLAHKKQAGTARERDATLFVRAITGTATRAPTPFMPVACVERDILH
jgi:hypothetical protein